MFGQIDKATAKGVPIVKFHVILSAHDLMKFDTIGILKHWMRAISNDRFRKHSPYIED